MGVNQHILVRWFKAWGGSRRLLSRHLENKHKDNLRVRENVTSVWLSLRLSIRLISSPQLDWFLRLQVGPFNHALGDTSLVHHFRRFATSTIQSCVDDYETRIAPQSWILPLCMWWCLLRCYIALWSHSMLKNSNEALYHACAHCRQVYVSSRNKYSFQIMV